MLCNVQLPQKCVETCCAFIVAINKLSSTQTYRAPLPSDVFIVIFLVCDSFNLIVILRRYNYLQSVESILQLESIVLRVVEALVTFN